MQKAAVLWTGGKDSALALWRVRDSLDVQALVTFVPEDKRPFRAHPIPLMQAQATAVGLPHQQVIIKPPFETGYRQAITQLVEQGIEVLVTGDIDLVGGAPNYVTERAKGLCEVQKPLWQQDRQQLLDELANNGFQAICTLAWDKFYVENPVGRMVDGSGFEPLARADYRDAYDRCGENGEYHSAVLAGPIFSTTLTLENRRVVKAEGAWGSYSHLAFDQITVDTLV